MNDRHFILFDGTSCTLKDRTIIAATYGSYASATYFPGVGTGGHFFHNAVDKLLAFTVDEQTEAGVLAVNAAPPGEVVLFGYSRGAAIARRVAARVTRPVRLICLDTVASIGLPDFSDDPREPAVVFENDRVGAAVTDALHILSMHEPRKTFTPTRMRSEPRIREVWVPGDHGDVARRFNILTIHLIGQFLGHFELCTDESAGARSEMLHDIDTTYCTWGYGGHG